MNTFTIPASDVEEIILTGEDGTYRLQSSIERDDDDREYNAAVDGLESLVLAHVCAGIDVTDPKYVEGVRTALEAIANQ